MNLEQRLHKVLFETAPDTQCKRCGSPAVDKWGMRPDLCSNPECQLFSPEVEVGEIDIEGHPIYLRAEKASVDASSWHQGSGVHADACQGIVTHHLERGDIAAAKAWADAAEVEAAELRRTNGVWEDNWERSPSGIATNKAKDASRLAGVDADELLGY